MSNYLDILAETIRNNWNRPALTDFYLTEDGKSQNTSCGDYYTYGEMYEEIVRVADLLTNLGLREGDHIAICGANSAHWVIAYLAIAKKQGVSITIMHSLQPDEIARLVDFSDAKALFVDGDIWEELHDKSFPQVESVIALDDWSILRGDSSIILNQKSLLLKNDGCNFNACTLDDLHTIFFTSGSTGDSKGVMLSIRNVSNNSVDFHNLFPASENDNYVSICPFAHLSGFMGDFISQLTLRKHIYISKEPLSLHRIYASLLLFRPYIYISVPKVLMSLIAKYGNKLFQEFESQ